jgi:hypothetical protein
MSPSPLSSALVGICDGDPARFSGFEARFAERVHPGDAIITKLWRTGDGEAVVQAETAMGDVALSQGRATFVA